MLMNLRNEFKKEIKTKDSPTFSTMAVSPAPSVLCKIGTLNAIPSNTINSSLVNENVAPRKL